MTPNPCPILVRVSWARETNGKMGLRVALWASGEAWSWATLLMQDVPSKCIETPCRGLSPRGGCQIPFPEGEACQASGGEGGG